METGLEKKIARLTEAERLKVSGYIDFLLDEETKKNLISEPEAIYKPQAKKDKTSKAVPNSTDAVTHETDTVPQKKLKREFGSLKGFITYIADDFDAPLEDFKEYM